VARRAQGRPVSLAVPAAGPGAACAGAAWLLLLVVLAAAPTGPRAQSGGIYSCIDDKGRRLTSDRPIPECLAKEQRVLNRDGSLKELRAPEVTPEERAQQEVRERQLAEQRAAQAEVVRRDRNLLQRYRDEAAHRRARDAALEPSRSAQASLQERVAELNRERAPLLAETEFYKGKPLPARLKSRLDANDAALAALRDSSAAQQAEAARVNRLYDVELERLRRLWAGAAPGSLGPIEQPSAVPAAAQPRR
jgi:hypothetical protein